MFDLPRRRSPRPSFRLPLCGSLLAVLVLSSSARAGVDRWTYTGPAGGPVRTLLADRSEPGRVYAVTDGGELFKTLDGARHWIPLRDGLPADTVWDLALAPSRPRTVYLSVSAGVDVRDLYRSRDGGVTWERRAELPVRGGLAVSAADPDVLFTVGFPVAYDPTLAVFRSADAGATWQKVFETLDSSSGIPVLAATPAGPSVLYLMLPDGVTRSRDGGETWQDASAVVGGGRLHDLTSFAVAPSAHDRLYAAGADLYRSDDGGVSWQELGERPTEDSGRLVVHPGDPDRLFLVSPSEVAESADGGETWDPLTVASAGSESYFQDLAVDAFSPGTFYLASGLLGVYTTRDGGERWMWTSQGFVELPAGSLAFDPWDLHALYAVTPGGGGPGD